MKEFIEKLIGRLEEKVAEYDARIQRRNGDCYYDERQNQKKLDERARGIEQAIEIVNQLAEEYKSCKKPSCEDCEVYDKEKHYCPKWCEVIKRTTKELEEEHNNDFCEHSVSGVTSCGQIFSGDSESGKCPYCGKKIKVIE